MEHRAEAGQTASGLVFPGWSMITATKHINQNKQCMKEKQLNEGAGRTCCINSACIDVYKNIHSNCAVPVNNLTS